METTNMLFLYLQDQDEDGLERLSGLCRRLLLQNDWEVRIRLCDRNVSAIAEKLDANDLPALFILEGIQSEELSACVRAIRTGNALHYIILLLGSERDALALPPPFYRPSGLLLKPVEERLLQRVIHSVYEDFLKTAAAGVSSFPVKIRNAHYAVPYQTILFFESRGKKIILRTAGQEYSFYGSIKQIAEAAPDNFIRVHKSYIVNIAKIKKVDFSLMLLALEDDSEVLVSRNFKVALKERLKP